MNKDGHSELRELLWRSRLSQAEEGRVQQLLTECPADELDDLLKERSLNQLLDGLPDAPVSSNFTARVLRAVELEALQNSRGQRGTPAWRVGFGWVSRLAMAGFFVLAGLFAINKHQENQRAELARSVATLSHVGAVPVEWLEDFDTIRNLNSATAVDDELLAALR